METIYQSLLGISLPSTDWCLLGPPTKFTSHQLKFVGLGRAIKLASQPLMWKLSGRANAQGGELAIFGRQQLVLANKLSSWGIQERISKSANMTLSERSTRARFGCLAAFSWLSWCFPVHMGKQAFSQDSDHKVWQYNIRTDLFLYMWASLLSRLWSQTLTI